MGAPTVGLKEYYMEQWQHIAGTLGRIRLAVELGTYEGHWARGLLDNCDVQSLWCIDPFEGTHFEPALPKWRTRVNTDFGERVFLVRGRSQEVARWFPYKPNLVYVDGSHTTPDAIEDIQGWWELLEPGGLMLVHDFDLPQVANAVKECWEKHDVSAWGPDPSQRTAWRVKDVHATEETPATNGN